MSYGAKILNLAPINLYYMGDAFRPSAGLYALLSSFGRLDRDARKPRTMGEEPRSMEKLRRGVMGTNARGTMSI